MHLSLPATAERRTVQIRCRVTPEEAERVARAAEERRLGLSSFMRISLMDAASTEADS